MSFWKKKKIYSSWQNIEFSNTVICLSFFRLEFFWPWVFFEMSQKSAWLHLPLTHIFLQLYDTPSLDIPKYKSFWRSNFSGKGFGKARKKMRVCCLSYYFESRAWFVERKGGSKSINSLPDHAWQPGGCCMCMRHHPCRKNLIASWGRSRGHPGGQSRLGLALLWGVTCWVEGVGGCCHADQGLALAPVWHGTRTRRRGRHYSRHVPTKQFCWLPLAWKESCHFSKQDNLCVLKGLSKEKSGPALFISMFPRWLLGVCDII